MNTESKVDARFKDFYRSPRWASRKWLDEIVDFFRACQISGEVSRQGEYICLKVYVPESGAKRSDLDYAIADFQLVMVPEIPAEARRDKSF